MKQFIKRTMRVIFNFQTRDEIYRGKRDLWTRIKWFIARGTRNIAITASYMLVAYGSARVYNSLSPVTVYADRQVIVTASSTMPLMLQRICAAESGKQFNKDGSVVRGVVDKSDLGYCQINERYNNDYARKLGIDIYTETGNKEFATILFNERGTQPWDASKCTSNGWGWKWGYCK